MNKHTCLCHGLRVKLAEAEQRGVKSKLFIDFFKRAASLKVMLITCDRQPAVQPSACLCF